MQLWENEQTSSHENDFSGKRQKIGIWIEAIDACH